MCSPATCRACGKTTWSGCGRHVDQVMSRVPDARQCTCSRAPQADGRGGGLRSLFRRR